MHVGCMRACVGRPPYMALTQPVAALDAVYPAQPLRVAEIRHDVADAATGCGADAAALLHINLAVSEAATNAIRHAYSAGMAAGDIHVRVQHADDFIDVSICDDGTGMCPSNAGGQMGLGLCLMAHEADSFAITSSPEDGTEVALRFRI